MKSPLIVTDAHPHQDFNVVTQLGLKAANLALLHKAALDERLSGGTIEGLVEDLDTFGTVVPNAVIVRDDVKVATAEQKAAAQKGYMFVRSVRGAARKSSAPKEVKMAYGVGMSVNPAIVRDVKAALKKIVDRAAGNKAEAAGIGLVKKDVDAMTAALAAIGDADKVQEQKRASAPLSTKERNRTANRIIQAVRRIVGAGMLEFAQDDEKYRAFEALKLPARKKGRKAKAQSTQAAKAPKPQAKAKAKAKA